ncbi:MAG: hypothetical protein EHM35_03410 [Planctomycetaceae bacterium]|nr:MAG: hypothetical protein EHM35_03410 [Planctomycetaceae bacterium]
MSTDRAESNGKNPMDSAIPQPPSDPIADNPKDVGSAAGSTPPPEVRAVHPEDQDIAALGKVVQTRPSVQIDGGNVPLAASISPSPESSSWSNAPVQTALPAGEFLTSVLRFKWSLVTILVLVAAPLVALIWTQITPQYEARAEIRVRPIIPRLVFKTDENGMIPLYDSFVNTQVSLIRGLTVLQRVLDQPEIRATRWYENRATTLWGRLHADTTPPLERLREALSVHARPRTEIIDVSLSASTAKEARLILDAILDSYIAYIGEKADATEDTLYRQLVDQYKSLETEIQGREKVCSDLHRLLGTEAPQELISARRIRLDELQNRLKQLQDARAMMEWRMNQAEVVDSNGVPADMAAEGLPRYYQDTEWRKLDTDVKTIQHQLTNGLYRPSHPNWIRLEQNLKFAEDLRTQREAQLNEQWRNQRKTGRGMAIVTPDVSDPNSEAGAGTLEYQLAQARQEEQILQAAFEKQQAEFKSLFESAQLLQKQNDELRSKRELFNAVQERLNQKNMERNVPGSIEVLARAYSPSRPMGDRRIAFTLLAVFLALGAGTTTAALKAGRNQSIYAVRDMPQQAQGPFLGHVPIVHLSRPVGKALGDELEQKQMLLNESVRMLRTALLSRLRGQHHTTVLVTSANEGTGKSSFTVVLGKSIAQTGQRVLIIDADLHKMDLSKRLHVADKPGLRESLKDTTLHVYATETSGLDVMPGGHRDNGNVVLEEIANSAFKNLVGRLFEQCGYNLILLDTPPILPVADATILAGQVDGAIMVEREHVSRRMEVANALVRLNCSGGRLLGTVFIGSPDQEHYGHGYSYRYGSGHKKEQS